MHSRNHGQTKYLQMTTDVTHNSRKLTETSSKAEESENRSVVLLKPIAPSAYNRANRRAASFTYNFNYGKFYEQWSVMVHNNTYFDIIQIFQKRWYCSCRFRRYCVSLLFKFVVFACTNRK